MTSAPPPLPPPIHTTRSPPLTLSVGQWIATRPQDKAFELACARPADGSSQLGKPHRQPPEQQGTNATQPGNSSAACPCMLGRDGTFSALPVDGGCSIVTATVVDGLAEGQGFGRRLPVYHRCETRHQVWLGQVIGRRLATQHVPHTVDRRLYDTVTIHSAVWTVTAYDCLCM